MLLSTAAILRFERCGHVTQTKVLPSRRVKEIIPAINDAYHAQQVAVYQQKLRVILGADCDPDLPLKALQQKVAALPEGCIPFLQAFNLWRTCPAVASLACSAEIAGTAAALLGCDRVRLFQDSLFIKRPGDGATHWHSDLAMTPLDSNSFVTCWLPLQPVPSERDGGTGLIFARGSHKDLALHFWYGDPRCDVDGSNRYQEANIGASGLALGDCTWHHGWTLHCAPPNPLQTPRRALAISFFADGDRRLRSPRRVPHSEDAESYEPWLEDVPPGHPARHTLLPLVWDSSRGGAQRILQKEAAHDSSLPSKAARRKKSNKRNSTCRKVSAT